MGIVRFVSVSMAAIVFVACVGVGASGFGASTVMGIAMLTFIIAFTLSMARLPQGSGGSDANAVDPPSKRSVMISIGLGACGSMAAFALLGFCAIAGPASGPIVWASLAIAAIVLWLLRGRHRMPAPVIDAVRTSAPAGRNTQDPADAALGEGMLADMSIPQLCQAWRQSRVALRDNRLDPAQRVQVAEARRRYLDELERRDPIGFSRWLESGARAGGDPLKFITSQARPMDPRNDDPPTHRELAD